MVAVLDGIEALDDTADGQPGQALDAPVNAFPSVFRVMTCELDGQGVLDLAGSDAIDDRIAQGQQAYIRAIAD